MLFHSFFHFHLCLSPFYYHFICGSNPHSQNWNTAHKNDSGNETYYVQTEAVEVELLNDEMVRKMTADERSLRCGSEASCVRHECGADVGEGAGTAHVPP